MDLVIIWAFPQIKNRTERYDLPVNMILGFFEIS